MAGDTLETVREIFDEIVGEGTGPRVEPGTRLSGIAVSSVQMLQIHARLEDALGLEIQASTLFEHDTVADLASYLDGCRDTVASS